MGTPPRPARRFGRLAAGLATGLLLVAGGAGPARATSTTGPDGVVRGELKGDLTLVGDPAGFIRDVVTEVRDLNVSVESTSGDFGVQTGSRRTTVTVSADVLFAFDKADLTPAARAKIADVAAELRAGHASGQVEVGGHADHLGNAAYNQDLSLRRAKAVVVALQPQLGGLPVTLVAKGFGATRPLAKETKPDGSDDPRARARNRRVSVTFDHPAR